MVKLICPECRRVFDMVDKLDVEEWSFGHDCEPEPTPPHGNTGIPQWAEE